MKKQFIKSKTPSPGRTNFSTQTPGPFSVPFYPSESGDV